MTVLSGLLSAALLLGAQDVQTPPPPAAPVVAQDPQTPPADPTVTDLGEIIVNNRPAREVATSFVDIVGAPATSRNLARWHGTVCVSVANLANEPAQYLIDRVSTVAAGLGLPAGEPGCVANVVIVAAVDASSVANAMVDEWTLAFRPGGSGMTRSLSVLNDFRNTDRPVRWWQVSSPVDSNTGERAVRLPGEDAPAVNVSRASRLRTDIRDDLAKVFIVIDVDKLEGVTIVQLADYVAMIAMAQVDIKAPTEGLPTVLNLFNAPNSTPGLTDWDMAYLQALYRAEPNRTTHGAQAADLAGLMLQRRKVQDAEPQE